VIARACEEILLSLGPSAEAYEHYAVASNRSTSYCCRLPSNRAEISREAEWFTAAKKAGLLGMAIELAN
jgi:hypothetical protein